MKLWVGKEELRVVGGPFGTEVRTPSMFWYIEPCVGVHGMLLPFLRVGFSGGEIRLWSTLELPTGLGVAYILSS